MEYPIMILEIELMQLNRRIGVYEEHTELAQQLLSIQKEIKSTKAAITLLRQTKP